MNIYVYCIWLIMLNLLLRVYIVFSGIDMCYVKDYVSYILLYGFVYSSIFMYIIGICFGYIYKGYIFYVYK